MPGSPYIVSDESPAKAVDLVGTETVRHGVFERELAATLIAEWASQGSDPAVR
jgi:hypothetical protein